MSIIRFIAGLVGFIVCIVFLVGGGLSFFLAALSSFKIIDMGVSDTDITHLFLLGIGLIILGEYGIENIEKD